MKKVRITAEQGRSDSHPHKLLVCGLLASADPAYKPVELRRGMTVLCQDGEEAGDLAAVVVTCAGREVISILLGEKPPTCRYRLIPSRLIDRVEGEIVRLSINAQTIETMPIHQPE